MQERVLRERPLKRSAENVLAYFTSHARVLAFKTAACSHSTMLHCLQIPLYAQN